MPSFITSKPAMGGSSPILKAGEYKFEVVNAEEVRAKSGNEMIELKLSIADSTVYDNLVFTERAFWKIDQFMKSVGCHPGEGKAFDVITDDLVGQRGTCKVRVGKNDKGNERNEIDSYTWEEF